MSLLTCSYSLSRCHTTVCSAADPCSNRKNRPVAGRQRRQAPAPKGTPATDRQLTSTAATGGAAALEANSQDLAGGYVPQRAIQMLNRYRALVLDSAYRPIDVVNWQRAICLDLLEKVDVLEYYEQSVSSVRESFFLPAVLRTRWYHTKPARMRKIALSRSNIMLRDNFECAYCGSKRDLTLDHIVPQSKGGKNTWQNLVTCCAACNNRKGDKTLKQLGWKLRTVPKEPSPYDLDIIMATLLGDSKQLPSEWESYLIPMSTRTRKSGSRQLDSSSSA